MHKIVLFDLDGTIADTLEDLHSAVNYALEKCSFSKRTIEQTRHAIGNGVEMLMRRSVPSGTEEKVVFDCLKDFKEYYGNHYDDKTTAYPGVLETLTTLKSRGYTVGVVTNKGHKHAINLLNKLYPNMFDVIQGHEDDIKWKPDPEPLFRALKKLGLSDYSVTYVGDSKVDYQLAKTAQIPAILVSYGYSDKKDLEALIKDVPIVDTPLELLNYLK